jgi:hypothetical protein
MAAVTSTHFSARRALQVFALAPAIALGASTCLPARPVPDGTCVVESSAAIDCTAPGYSGSLLDAGLVAHSCSGGARPDQFPKYIQGIPQGVVCADKGPLGDSGRTAYCCTESISDCVYDPVSDCDESTFGVQCRGGNRPESLNPALSCSNGLPERDFTNYCCSGKRPPSPCLQSDALGCSDTLLGFLCKGDSLPTGEDLGPNKSRADYFHPTCSIAKVAPNPAFKSYCCFMPAPTPKGGTCVSHPTLAGCAAGRFGFACYGPDRPEQDNLPMQCDDAGTPGKSAEGYPATVFCCDLRE